MPLTRRRVRSYHSTGPATYIDDRFGGAAATLAGRTPDTVGTATWTIWVGAASTNGTQATDTGGGLRASIESGHADCSVSVTLAGVGAGDPGLLFRGVDNIDYWYLIWQPGFPRWNLSKVITNAATLVDGTHTTPVPVNGDVLKVVLSGDSITCYLNGVSFLTATSAQFNTATKHGLATITAGTAVWDNFLVAS